MKVVKSFTEKYDVARLVYFEQFDDPENAIRREKRLKKWNRAWKIRLIEEHNPNWDDLYPGIAGGSSSPRRFPYSPSCPAQAGHPVRRGVRC